MIASVVSMLDLGDLPTLLAFSALAGAAAVIAWLCLFISGEVD